MNMEVTFSIMIPQWQKNRRYVNKLLGAIFFWLRRDEVPIDGILMVAGKFDHCLVESYLASRNLARSQLSKLASVPA